MIVCDARVDRIHLERRLRRLPEILRRSVLTIEDKQQSIWFVERKT